MSFAPKPVFFWAVLSFCVALFPAAAWADDIYVLTDGGSGNSTITKVTSSGDISIFATLPGQAFSLAIDSGGNLFAGMAQPPDEILKISNNGSISTFASGLGFPESLAVDSRDNLFVHVTSVPPPRALATSHAGFLKITPAGAVSPFAPGTEAGVIDSRAMTFDAHGDLITAHFNTVSRISISPTTGVATESFFVDPKAYPRSLTEKAGMAYSRHDLDSLAFGPDGNLYVVTREVFSLNSPSLRSVFGSKSDQSAKAIYKITPAGVVSKLADRKGGHMVLAFNSQGQLFAADDTDGIIYKVSNAGVFTPFVSGLTKPYQIAIVSTPKLIPNAPWLKSNLFAMLVAYGEWALPIVFLAVLWLWWAKRRKRRAAQKAKI